MGIREASPLKGVVRKKKVTREKGKDRREKALGGDRGYFTVLS